MEMLLHFPDIQKVMHFYIDYSIEVPSLFISHFVSSIYRILKRCPMQKASNDTKQVLRRKCIQIHVKESDVC